MQRFKEMDTLPKEEQGGLIKSSPLTLEITEPNKLMPYKLQTLLK